MAKFQFRLQKVLEFRARAETTAKNLYLAKRSEVLAAEAVIGALRQRRLDALSEPRSAIDHYRRLEAELQRIDDEERAQKVVVSLLNDEAEALRIAWTRHKQDLETMEKLREKALTGWISEVNRKEQAELDEWAAQRRAA
ncbi:MAG: flagellar export protein FliJ [Fimbriimonadaceae bacterium]